MSNSSKLDVNSLIAYFESLGLTLADLSTISDQEWANLPDPEGKILTSVQIIQIRSKYRNLNPVTQKSFNPTEITPACKLSASQIKIKELEDISVTVVIRPNPTPSASQLKIRELEEKLAEAENIKTSRIMQSKLRFKDLEEKAERLEREKKIFEERAKTKDEERIAIERRKVKIRPNPIPSASQIKIKELEEKLAEAEKIKTSRIIQSKVRFKDLEEKAESLEREKKIFEERAKTKDEERIARERRKVKISEYISHTRDIITAKLKNVQEMVSDLRRHGSNLDICFCMDATGSMGEIINSVKNCIIQVSRKISECTGMACRFAMVAYRDYCDGALRHQIMNFGNCSNLQTFLGSVTAQGGEDGPEDCFGGIYAAINRVEWKAPSKIII